MAMKKEIRELPTSMLDLHQYYKICSGAGQSRFGVLVPTIIFHKGQEETMYVEFESLFQLFQRRDLVVQILSL